LHVWETALISLFILDLPSKSVQLLASGKEYTIIIIICGLKKVLITRRAFKIMKSFI